MSKNVTEVQKPVLGVRRTQLGTISLYLDGLTLEVYDLQVTWQTNPRADVVTAQVVPSKQETKTYARYDVIIEGKLKTLIRLMGFLGIDSAVDPELLDNGKAEKDKATFDDNGG